MYAGMCIQIQKVNESSSALFFQPFCGNERNWIFRNLEFSGKFLEFRQKFLEFSRTILEFEGKWLGFKTGIFLSVKFGQNPALSFQAPQ